MLFEYRFVAVATIEVAVRVDHVSAIFEGDKSALAAHEVPAPLFGGQHSFDALLHAYLC